MKNSELWTKQSKDLSLINQEIKKIENTALNSKSSKALLDENNIDKAKTDLEEIKSIYDTIFKGHENKEIIQTEAFDLLEIKLKNIKNDINKCFEAIITASR